MSIRTHFPIILGLVLLLVGVVRAESIEVTNGSFELDVNGVQIDWKEATMEHVLAWENTPGLFGYAGVNGSLSKHPGSDGRTYAWGNNYDGGSGFYQVLDHAIVPGKHYTVIYDAKNLWNEEPNHTISFFYLEGSDHIVLGSQDYLITTENTPVWDHLDIEMLWTSLPDEPYIGKPLGIKFYFPHQGSTIYTGIDNVRLESKDACYAWKPQPEDGAREVAKDVTLSWNPGLWSASHEVYLGTSWVEINDANTNSDAFQGAYDTNSWSVLNHDANGLELGQTYFWRVDEVNEMYGGPEPPAPPNGRWKGEVWMFRITGYALNPYPADGATDVVMSTSISWIPGTDAKWHDVYFGTSFEDVNEADKSDANIYQQTLALDANSYDVSGELMLGETFYWRIDEVNELTLKGDIWRFTTRNYIILEDFDSYTSPSILRQVWNDGNINETGSGVTVETEIIRDGKSLKFSYCNLGYWAGCGDYYYSEIGADVTDLEVFSNWRYGGAESLVLWFYGDWDNDANEQMYVVLEDSGTDAEVHYYGDMNDIRLAEWQEWNIGLDEFAGVDANDIAKVYIGFGERGNTTTLGGTGEVCFEDIRLYARRCVPKLAYKTGSFDGDCFVDYYDLALLGQEWLLQAKGLFEADVPEDLPAIWYQFEEGTGTVVSNSGYMEGEDGIFGDDYAAPAWTPSGYDGTGGLVFDNGSIDEVGDYVLIPAPNFNTNTLTITAWVKRDGEQNIYAPIVFSRQSDDPNVINNTTVGISFGSTGDPDWLVNNELIYTWEGMESTWDWHTDFIVPDSLWTFIAVTIAPTEANLYMYVDGELTIEAATNYIAHGVEEFDGTMYLGWNTLANTRFYNGVMDDVRIYERTLTPAEIMGLAGLTGEHYIPLEPWRNNPDDNDSIDLRDYTIMANYWLEDVSFPIP